MIIHSIFINQYIRQKTDRLKCVMDAKRREREVELTKVFIKKLPIKKRQ